MRWIWVLALVAACGKSKAACKADVADLMVFLRTMDHSRSWSVPGDVHLVERPDLKPTDGVEGPVIYIRANGVDVQGKHVAVDELPHVLEDLANKMLQDITDGKVLRHFVWDHRVYVMIDRDAPWSTVTAVARAAEATGYSKWIAMFSKPSPVAAPARSSVSDQLDKVLGDNTGSTATELARLTSEVAKSCKPLVKAFGAVGSEAYDNKSTALIEETGPALIECNCDLDMPALRSLYYAIVGNPHPLTVAVITLDKTATPIALPPATPWHDAAMKLATGTAWLQ